MVGRTTLVTILTCRSAVVSSDLVHAAAYPSLCFVFLTGCLAAPERGKGEEGEPGGTDAGGAGGAEVPEGCIPLSFEDADPFWVHEDELGACRINFLGDRFEIEELAGFEGQDRACWLETKDWFTLGPDGYAHVSYGAENDMSVIAQLYSLSGIMVAHRFDEVFRLNWASSEQNEQMELDSTTFDPDWTDWSLRPNEGAFEITAGGDVRLSGEGDIDQNVSVLIGSWDAVPFAGPRTISFGDLYVCP